MMRQIQLLFTALFLLVATGLNAQFNITATTTPEFCAGTGAATFNITNAAAGATFDFVITQLPGTTPYRTVSDISATAANFSYTENLLPAGNYSVKAIQNNGGTLTEKSTSFTISNNFKPLTFTLKQLDVCGGVNIQVIVSQGQPVQYELRDTSNNVLIPFQSSNILGAVTTNGTYRVAVKDVCGNVVVKDVIVTINTAKFVFYEKSPLEISSCDEYSATLGLNSYLVPQNRYPVNITIRIENATTGLDTTTTWIANSYAELTKTIAGLPMTGTNKVTISYIDACGDTASYISNTTPKQEFTLSVFNASCGGKYLGVGTFKWFYNGAPVTVRFIQYPSGFNPVNFNSDFANDNDGDDYSHTYPTLPSSPVYPFLFGSVAQSLPPGTYKVEVTSCGRSSTYPPAGASYNITIPATQPLVMASVVNDIPCDVNKGLATIRPNIETDLLQNITVTAAPPAFVSEFGSLPYDLSSYIGNAANYMNPTRTTIELPVGTYTFSYKDTCGRTAIQTFYVVGRTFTASPVTYKRFCGGGFQVTATLPSYNGNPYVMIQKKHPSGWGNPTNSGYIGFPNVSGSGATAIRIGGAYGGGTSAVINTSGEFRVVAVWSSPTTGINPGCTNFEVLDTFTIDTATLSLKDFYVVACADNTYNLMLDATGIGVLKYKIVEKDGQPFTIDNGTDPVFTGLAQGSYKVEITDSECLDIITANVRVIANKLPSIKTENLCEGENGKLYVNGASYLTVEWFKDGVSTGVFGHTYPFTPYSSATGLGLYEAHLSYAPNPNSCIDNVLSFNLTPGIENTPHAGTGQTVTIYQNTVTGPINLFNYLTAPYDNHGYWTDINNSGLLIGNNWYGQFANGGTYQFKYIVNGTCSNTDEATVTIKLEGYCLNNPASPGIGGTDTKVGITLLKRAGAENTDNWPMLRKSGHIALESNTKGFVVTRMAKANLGNITKPQEGMMVYDTTDKCLKIYSDGAWRCFNQPACP